MNDPWDVKSVRQSGQYMSCMKINGIPLLPPVLSKECRKEMQYYKLLAKEVEKRIALLQPYISDSDTDTSEDKTDAPELPENEMIVEIAKEDVKQNVEVDKVDSISKQKHKNEQDKTSFDNHLLQTTDVYSSLQSNITVVEANGISSEYHTPNLIIDLSLNINETGKNAVDNPKKTPQRASPPHDVPERDCEYTNKFHKKELLTELNTGNVSKRDCKTRGMHLKGIVSRNPFTDLPLNQDGPSSLSSKSFTGSLNDIHTDSMRESQIAPKLNRQRSYTLLKPGPQLLAHLEVQSMNTGVAISCISMSESLSNLSTPNKKRRSWDLESAKVKWSSMAMELKDKSLPNKGTTNVVKNQTRPAVKKTPVVSPPRARSLAMEKSRQESVSKTLPKSEPVQRNRKSISPVRKVTNNNNVKEPHSTSVNQNVQTPARQNTQLISESEDPASRVRELYEKIQKQQLLQMATLVEKQKREQMLLQQVFEEQNNLLYKQLKTICPKSPMDDKNQEVARGPVSLSQLINHKSPDQSSYENSLSSTLTDTSQYISHCDDILKKSRDITDSLKKQQPKSRSQNGTKIQSPRTSVDGSRTRTQSPARNTSRKLNYDTSASSERDYEPALTDRTNDTMADLNVTFPSDNSGDYPNNNIVKNHLCGQEMTVMQTSPTSTVSSIHCRTESTLKSQDRPIHSSGRSSVRVAKPKVVHQPTPKEREAATKIVAVARGFLVRRLMRTERVQGIVQTIRDALLCALQLHQDREGIRGADVDLHRRLIQQITAACYTLHDTFVTSTPAERCAMIAADRGRRRSLAARQTPKPFRQTDLMSQSHTGAFPPRSKRPTSASLMTQSNYETFSGKCTTVSRSRYMPSPRRRPWR